MFNWIQNFYEIEIYKLELVQELSRKFAVKKMEHHQEVI